jgi:hypothetical protein
MGHTLSAFTESSDEVDWLIMMDKMAELGFDVDFRIGSSIVKSDSHLPIIESSIVFQIDSSSRVSSMVFAKCSQKKGFKMSSKERSVKKT